MQFSTQKGGTFSNFLPSVPALHGASMVKSWMTWTFETRLSNGSIRKLIEVSFHSKAYVDKFLHSVEYHFVVTLQILAVFFVSISRSAVHVNSLTDLATGRCQITIQFAELDWAIPNITKDW